MRKVLVILSTIIAFFIIYFLQTNFFNWFTIAKIQPNLFIILILFCGMFIGKMQGMILGVVYGLIIDLLLNNTVGITAIMLGIIGFATGFIEKNFSTDSRLNIMLVVIGSTFVYELGEYILKIFMSSIEINILAFIKIVLIEMFFNAMITIIIYPLFQFLGEKSKNSYSNNKVMRYY